MTHDTCSNVSSPRWFHRARLLEAAPTAMQLWEMAIRFTLNLLIITILVGLVGGVVKTFMDLRLLLSTDLEVALRHIIVDTLTILAVVEVLKTTLKGGEPLWSANCAELSCCSLRSSFS
jgi:hypothetical protein